MTAPFKLEHGSKGHLNPSRVETVVSVQLPDGPNQSVAALYAHLEPTVRAPTQVAVRLESELLGTRQLVATVAIPPGYNGIVAVASGIVADSWHGTAYGVLQRGSLHMKLGTRACCSSFAVSVPAELTTRLVPRLLSAVPAACMPLVRHEGAYNVLWLDADGTLAVAPTERILRVVAVSNDVGPGGLSGLGTTIIHWPQEREVIFEPRGNAEGPRTLTFTNIDYCQVEVVH
jgi:hypothetical protein